MDIQAQLAAAGRQMHFLLTTPVEIVETTVAPNGRGGVASTSTVKHKTCAMIETRTVSQGVGTTGSFDKVNTLGSHKITLPLNTPVTVGDAVVADGVRYEVVSVPTNTYEALLVIEANRAE